MMKDEVFLIAEIGINHNGSLDIATNLIDLAIKYGWNAVKLQKRNVRKVIPKSMWNKPKETPWGEMPYIEYKERLEFGKDEYDFIDEYCKLKGINWFASAWDLESQEFLRQYDLKYNKIASPMITYRPLLEMVASEGKLTFISTGMATWKDIDKAVKIFKREKCPFVLMHCVGTYPAKDEELNLSLIPKLAKRYKCEVGYSCHNPGVLPAALAVVYGARYIEKHITLDRTMWGSDQAASLEPHGMELVRKYCDAALKMIGDGKKRILEKEREIAKKLRYWEVKE